MGVDQSLRYSKDEIVNIGKSVPISLLPIISIEQKESVWQPRDSCLAKYSEDGLYYRAKILSISADETECEVLYTEYKTKEIVSMKDLLTDYGIKKKDMVRIAQPSQNRVVVKNEIAPSNGFASVTNVNGSDVSKANDNDMDKVNNQFSNLKITAEPTKEIEVKNPEIVKVNRQSVTGENDAMSPNHKITDAAQRTESGEQQQLYEKDSISKMVQNMDIGDMTIPPEFNAGGDVNRENIGDLLMTWYMDGYRAGFEKGRQMRNEESENLDVKIAGH